MDATNKLRMPSFFLIISAVHLILTTTLASHKPETEIIQYRALEGLSSVVMKCNLTKSSAEDAIQLIFWYKGESNKPIYSVDARNVSNLKHFNYYSRKIPTSPASKQQADLASRISVKSDFSLCIERLSIEDSGFYRCRVDFRYSRTLNTMAKLNVIVPPKSIKIQTENGSILNGSHTLPIDENSDLILRCLVTGASPPAKLTCLYADSMDPILENEYLITAKAIQAYRDTENNKTQTNSVSYQARWPVEKYTITQLPSSISNNSNNSENQLQSVSILNVRNLTREDVDRRLICQAKNSNLTSPLTKMISINMNLRPLYVQIVSVQRPLSADKSTSLICESDGSRPKAQISWYLNGIGLKSFREQYSSESNVTTSELLFQANADHQGSILTCKARNERLANNELFVQWTLDVFYKPKVEILVQTSENDQPELLRTAQAVESSELIFQCKVKSNPPVIQIGFIFRNKPIIDDARNGIIIQNSTLIIKKAKRFHSGNYSCYAVNIEGKNYSASIDVNVKHTPYCGTGQQQVYGAAPGETIAISCLLVSKLTKQANHQASPKQLAPKRSPVRFIWRLTQSNNDTLLPPNLYSRGQLIHPSPTSNTITNSLDLYSASLNSNYEFDGAESSNNQQTNSKYNHVKHSTSKQEEWSNNDLNSDVHGSNQLTDNQNSNQASSSGKISRTKRIVTTQIDSNLYSDVNKSNHNHFHQTIIANQDNDFKMKHSNQRNQSTFDHSNEQLNWLTNDVGSVRRPISLIRSKKNKKNYFPQSNHHHFNTNSIHKDDHSFSTYSNYNNESELYISKLNLDTKLYSFGMLECYAENEIGIQEEPCIYQIIQAGPPEMLKDCRILNETWYSLNVHCKPGFDGGFKQIFHLIAYETELISHFNLNSANSKKYLTSGLKDQRNFVFNLTNIERPEFYLNQLKSGVSYLLLVYAVNEKGSSPFFTLIGQTVAMLRQTIPNENEQIIKIDASIAVVTCVCFTIFLISSIIVLIIRIRNKDDSLKKSNIDQNGQIDRLNQYDCNNEVNSCEESMINTFKSSTLKSSSKTKTLKKATLVKKKFIKDELISDKLFDNEKYSDNHFHHHHHHFDDHYIDTDTEMPKEQDLVSNLANLANLEQGAANIYLLDFQSSEFGPKIIDTSSFSLNAPHHLSLQNNLQNTDIYPSEATIAFETFSTPV